ncbi:hypothetical protein HMN09_00025700 [Mycena chlorophos]|uniref:DUF6534 domain-containing protein n=1 Tax=Mycena chlorophos TaxID=658473 RepID=A0A8H6WPM0_MYCCL|nr:hypothetical protein HMN09_00025700 [Mycena chlorophos]
MSSNSTEVVAQPTFQFLTPKHLSPLVIGTWTTIILFGFELGLLAKYIRSQKRTPRAHVDSILLKLGVLVNALADGAGTAACCAAVYLYTIADWGNANTLAEIKWPLYVVVFSTGVVTAISQFFMIVRYWSLTQHHLIFVFLFFTLLVSLAGIFGSGVFMIISPEKVTKLINLPKIFLYFAVVASCVGTGLTTILLLVHKRRTKNDHLKNAGLRSLFQPPPKQKLSSRSFISRFFSGIIETGLLTTAVTVAGAILEFGKLRETRVYLACGFVVARVYACTMLYILCNRPSPQLPASEPVVASNIEIKPVIPPVSVMEDDDTFRITKKRIALRHTDSRRHIRGGFVESDSSSDVSKNLNDELHDMEKGPVHLRIPKSPESDESDSEYEEEGSHVGLNPRVGVDDEDEVVVGQKQALSEDEAGDLGLAIPPVKPRRSAEGARL